MTRFPLKDGKIHPGAGLPLGPVVLGTLGGGLALSLLALAFQSPGASLGFFLGGFMAILSLYGMKSLWGGALRSGGTKPPAWIFLANLLRCAVMAYLLYWLLQQSLACLLAAVAVYIWFLAVLSWVGMKYAPPLPNSSGGEKPR